MSSNAILVTGAAGFIGFHLSKRLLEQGVEVVGYDNVNDYYDISLKESRLEILKSLSGFTFVKGDLKNFEQLDGVFANHRFDCVINLAAQAGVRYSLENPFAYAESNLVGFLNLLEACRKHKPSHLIYASSSSVYGANRTMPFSVHHNVDHPISLYAASKKSNELMAHAYSSLYQIPTTGLRFFTVYGPYGRPDMATFIFTKAILEGKVINVYNNGKMMRDFTYIDDIIEGIVRLIPKVPDGNSKWSGLNPDPSSSFAPYRLYNIGNNKPVELLYFIEVIEKKLGMKAVKNYLPLHDGDVVDTFADVDDLINDVGFKPATSIETGISNFIDWYQEFYRVKV